MAADSRKNSGFFDTYIFVAAPSISIYGLYLLHYCNIWFFICKQYRCKGEWRNQTFLTRNAEYVNVISRSFETHSAPREMFLFVLLIDSVNFNQATNSDTSNSSITSTFCRSLPHRDIEIRLHYLRNEINLFNIINNMYHKIRHLCKWPTGPHFSVDLFFLHSKRDKKKTYFNQSATLW